MNRTARLYLIIGGILVVLAVALVLATRSQPQPSQNFVGTHWKLVKLNGNAPLAAINPLTLNFDSNNQVSGNSGCNSYGGDFAVRGSALIISKMFSTLMACADQSVNDQEAAFNQAMSSVASFEISNGQFSLKDASGIVVLVFGKA